jgi:Ribbon-helix-helix protein, copG family
MSQVDDRLYPHVGCLKLVLQLRVSAYRERSILVSPLMAKSIEVNQNKRGRPAAGRDAVSAVRLPVELTAEVDKWAETHDSNRSEAIRQLIEIGLTVKSKPRQSSDSQKLRAREMAGVAIDRMTDIAAPADDQAGRKRRLLKGPEEFRDTRVDRPKRK